MMKWFQAFGRWMQNICLGNGSAPPKYVASDAGTMFQMHIRAHFGLSEGCHPRKVVLVPTTVRFKW